MPNLVTKNRRRIREAVEFLSGKNRSVTLRLEGDSAIFSSGIIKADHGDLLAGAGSGGNLLVEMLSPETGNGLIGFCKSIKVSFSLGKSDYEFISHYIRKSLVSPYYGHLITYPESITIMERRRGDRHEIDTSQAPLFVNALITVKSASSLERTYNLKVFDISENGVGLLVERETEAMLEEVDVGKRLEEMELLASWTTIKVSGTVKRKSKIKDGKYADLILLGIRLDEKLEHYI